ncbi:2-amino-4-hydroxy-6-hydroxymethyldihydropteridine diphosphokinase [Tahibacter harae]|uniref:2-amino-4-hydroxy-6-hydroxymethyldihydropteridine pyrophosphokinase n=1 Tax=Tahibacter harae TaxID=2963937 RepID=A0ABT1QZ99_9GAMM|nr:2-amino-4-hydroxy-6-hydroxymethyldihydropteridine diphosphokinase [Tahibacter harae]MCQ4167619.1 2-amino-4-hydroxy-6-hydroxymethyldihydropteridine diphosphokinase [Tahibacter harae]
MQKAYLSLGSNQEPRRHLALALQELRERFGDLVASAAYRFPAVGFDGPDFVNLAAVIGTDLPPQQLNDWLHALEDRHGRRRDVPRFSDRTLDVDIVLYGDAVLSGRGNLQLPRDELRHAFVLLPLAQIAPEVQVPGRGLSLGQLWREHPDHATAFEVVPL